MKKKTMWIGGIAIGAALVLSTAGIAVAVTEPWDNDDDDLRVEQVDTRDADNRDDDSRATDTRTVDPEDALISESERAEASAAALAETGTGTVTDVERSDDLDRAWEVEVTFDDGRDVDVELDEQFVVVFVD